MAATITHEIEFEELMPVIDDRRVKGMMLYGTAKLVSNDPESDPKAFYVDEITIDGGLVLKRPRSMREPSDLREMLFVAMAGQIESDRTDIGRYAQAEFSEAVEESRQPDPDRAHDEMRDRSLGGIHA